MFTRIAWSAADVRLRRVEEVRETRAVTTYSAAGAKKTHSTGEEAANREIEATTRVSAPAWANSSQRCWAPM